MNVTAGSSPAVFRDLEEIVVGSHIFLPVEAVDGAILPCIHVLCRSCVETVSSRTGMRVKDRMKCAACELEFEVPSTEALHKRKPVTELLLEFSKAANDIKHLCENSCTWNEVNSRSASTYCTVCKKHACFLCADKQHKNHQQSVEKRSHFTKKPPNFGFCGGHKWHFKQLEVFCIACCKADCFMPFVENLPYEMKIDFDKILADEIQSLNELSKEFRVVKTQVENDIQLESWKKEKRLKLEADYKELIKAEEKQKNSILDKLKSFSTQVMKDLEQKTGKQTRHLDPSTTEHEIQFEVSCQGRVEAIESHRNSLLDQFKPVNTEVKEELEKKKNNIDALLKTVDRYRNSCDSIQSRGKDEEKFCAVGAILKKVEELKTELNFRFEQTHPTTSNESSDLKKRFKSEMQWKDQRESDDAVTDTDAKRQKDERTNETVGNFPKCGYHVQSSMSGESGERSKNASATFDMHTKEDEQCEDRENCGLTFPEALAKYKEMLEKMRNQIIPVKVRAKDKRPISLLKIEEAAKLRQQFNHVSRIRPIKLEATHWKSIEQCHDQLVNLACREAEGDRFKKNLDEMNRIIENLLKQIAAMEVRSQQGLRNFGNTCYFNAVIQCLCQTFPFLEGLSSRNTTQQPLTEAFVRFWNHRCIGSPEQNEAFSKFLEQLYTSSPKFNNNQQHDSHDLFIHFLNDLRSEERLHTTKDPRFHIDPRKVLTTVDKVFGGHFITMYACLKCDQPYFVCECLLDISLPICIPMQQHQQSFSRRGTGETYQVSSQRDRGSTVDKRQNLVSYSYQDKESTVLLEALNEEERTPTDEGRRYHTRPVALTECLRFYTATEYIPEGYLCLSCQDGNQSAAAVNAQTMPPALKRTLIYNPPAVLVLHMKRFERTATGFTKRSDRVSYEELLDLGPYCSSDCLRMDPEDKNVWYSLYGVVVHSGSLESGHYVAYVKIGESNAKSTKAFLQEKFLNRDTVAIEQKNKLSGRGERAGRKVKWQPKPATDGEWIHVSDSYTRDATSHEALNQEAFMLFYERVPKRDQ